MVWRKTLILLKNGKNILKKLLQPLLKKIANFEIAEILIATLCQSTAIKVKLQYEVT